MNPTLREDIAVIGTTAFAMILAIGAGVLIPFIGFAQTAAIFGTVCVVYLIVTGMLRLTILPLLRPAPAPAPAPADDNNDGD